jgi:histidinol phosphatase-like enzyme
MKVVFLDIDGVLNEEKSRSRCCGYKGIDDKKVGNLAKIVKQTNAEIVLISTWKDDWRKTDKAQQSIMANY